MKRKDTEGVDSTCCGETLEVTEHIYIPSRPPPGWGGGHLVATCFVNFLDSTPDDTDKQHPPSN